MEQDNICPSCKVKVSSDLSNCPLCGKHIRDKAATKVNPKSYPIYDTKFVQTATWYTFIKAICLLAMLICVFINLIFPTNPAWWPYVISAIIMFFYVFIRPIKVSARNYVKSLTFMSFFISAFLIFIDAYNYYCFDTPFGWAMSYSVPFIMLAAVVASTMICFWIKRYEFELLSNIAFTAVFSIIYFIIMVCFFKGLPSWASLVLMCASIGLIVILEIFKRRKIITELSHEFHV